MDWSNFLTTPLLSQDFIASMSSMTSSVELIPPSTNPMDPTSPTFSAPKPQKRCPTCSHKLKLADTTCKCGLRHCSAHRLPETHACTFDHKAADRKMLETQVVKCVADKIADRI